MKPRQRREIHHHKMVQGKRLGSDASGRKRFKSQPRFRGPHGPFCGPLRRFALTIERRPCSPGAVSPALGRNIVTEEVGHLDINQPGSVTERPARYRADMLLKLPGQTGLRRPVSRVVNSGRHLIQQDLTRFQDKELTRQNTDVIPARSTSFVAARIACC